MQAITIFFITIIVVAVIGTIVYSLSDFGIFKPLMPVTGIEKENKIQSIQKKSNLQEFIYIAIITIFTRIFIIFISIIATFFEKGFNCNGSNFWNAFHDIFIKSGDTPHYINIAQNWYTAIGSNAKNIVFYPLYPFCIRILNFIIGDFFISGIIISNISLVIACYFLYRLVCIDNTEEDAKRSVAFLLIYPFSIFLVGVFTESLFIMLSVLVLYHMRKQQWHFVALFGFLASLSRFQGVLLIIPALYEYFLVNNVFQEASISWKSFFSAFKKIKASLLLILVMPLGFGVYLLCNRLVQGDWFSFYKHIAAEPWWQGKDWVGNNLLQHYNMSQQHYSLGIIIYKVQIIEFFFIIGLFFYGIIKKIRTSYLAYMLIYLIFCYTSSWLISGPRYILGDIPIFIILAVASQKTFIRILFMLTSALLFVLYSIAFMQGQAIM